MSTKSKARLNGLVSIDRTIDDQGNGIVELFDYEQTWTENATSTFVLKCYDQHGRIIYIRIDKDTMIEAVVGDPSHPLPDPNDDEPGGNPRE